MTCDLCRGEYQAKLIVFSFDRKGQTVVVEGVPAHVCERCGDVLLSERVVQEVEQLLDQELKGTAPLYRFPQKVAP